MNKGLAKEEEVENMCGVDGTERDSTKLLQPSFFTQGVLNKLTVNLVRVKRVKSCYTQCSIHFFKKDKKSSSFMLPCLCLPNNAKKVTFSN